MSSKLSDYITDIGKLVNGTGGMKYASHSTTKNKDNTTLDMTDFLTLMVVQLQNQTIDSTMDTSDMLNQMVQMQMITALTNMTDASVMSYASSLVGKEVTIGDYSSGTMVERVITVTGTGVSNGQQVIFAGDEVFNLSSVMAVGRLPKKVEDSEGTENGGDTTEKPTDPVEGTDEGEGSGEVPDDRPVDGTEETGGADEQPEENDGGVDAADQTGME